MIAYVVAVRDRVFSVSINESESLASMSAVANLPASVRGGNVRRFAIAGANASEAFSAWSEGKPIKVEIDINDDGKIVRSVAVAK